MSLLFWTFYFCLSALSERRICSILLNLADFLFRICQFKLLVAIFAHQDLIEGRRITFRGNFWVLLKLRSILSIWHWQYFAFWLIVIVDLGSLFYSVCVLLNFGYDFQVNFDLGCLIVQVFIWTRYMLFEWRFIVMYFIVIGSSRCLVV